MTGGRVVVLGPTGRNFGAGMSGGIAYLLDLWDSHLNPEMVLVEELDAGDEVFLRDVVERHRELTGSTVAARLLAEWAATVARFTKVMPKDYKRVLTVMHAAEAEGLDESTTLARVMEAAHG
jgi:glutamate synthase (NADPH/NADH) large chain